MDGEWELQTRMPEDRMGHIARAQAQAGEPPLGVEFDPVLQPVQAVEHLKKEQPLGRGFADIDWGGYLLYQLWPIDRVFIDGQTDFYGEDLALDYIKIRNLGEGWQALLDGYGIRWVLFRTDSPLARELALKQGWRVDYQDVTATVLMRTEEAG